MSQNSWALNFLKAEELQRCSKTIETIILSEFAQGAQLLASDLWQKIPVIGSSSEPEMSYCLPDTIDASELEVRIHSGRMIVQFNKGQIQYGWKLDTQSCEVKERFQSVLAPEEETSTSDTKAFTSENLKQLLTKSVTGAIYVWSPHMILSVIGIPVVEEVCRSLNVPLTILMDPGATPLLTADVREVFQLKESSILLNQASALSLIGSELHYPNLILYRNGSLLPGVLFGVKSHSAYKSFVLKNLKLGQSE